MTSIGNREALKRGLDWLTLTGVELANRELGSGAFGRTFVVKHNGIACAAKEIDFGSLTHNKAEFLKQIFLQQCLLCSNLDHPNVVKLLGVYYSNEQIALPALVTELMEYSLTVFLQSFKDNIPMFVKLSILQDVGRGVHYLHTQEMMHCNLHSNNVVLTKSMMAKICDFMAVKVGGTHERMDSAFSSPEVLGMSRFYGKSTASDVFSFGCIVYHVISQHKPDPFLCLKIYPGTGLAVNKDQDFINEISDESLKELVISCLNIRPERRPLISQINERISGLATSRLMFT